MRPYDIVEAFEREVAVYAGAPYAVAVNCCTNALFLALVREKEKIGKQKVELPCRTYVGVAQAVLNSGNEIQFRDYIWRGSYVLFPFAIVDSARQFYRGMYNELKSFGGAYVCLSFHWYKHIPIGRGGMILCNNWEDAWWFRRARHDGRTPGTPAGQDLFSTPGYHCYMHPDDAAKGLMFMGNVQDKYEDVPWDDYPDLSKQEVFQC